MKILIENLTKTAGPPGYRDSIKRLTRKAARLGVFPDKKKSVNVVLVSNHAIQSANRAFRGKNAPTDVLSFCNDDEGIFDDLSMGDIMIALDVARKQARENELTLRSEITRLYVHGLLHLCGYTHKTKKEEARMMSLQDRIWAGER